MKFGIVVFPGSNCDRDMQNALQDDLQQEVKMLWHKDNDLSDFTTDDCIVLPGGFSYGDYLRCGALARFSPMMEQVIEFANKGGKVLGVCNGFQILCEAGLLPGVLLQNDHQKFTCKNTYIVNAGSNNIVSDVVGNGALKIPVAHGEGRYHADAETLKKLEENNQIIFKYCDENGEISDAVNPNGTTLNIAGICNEGRNVFGMMPHPERACSPQLNNLDGQAILRAFAQN
ncbi:phosphoribosylformylglycinamidine synthase I [Edaphocola flava]|jgi:phosphoribosylformylglycinamidine synthase|uniref:phosphoribosylformylglycinamidine synthase I n=1 Tax=Edaphocola flava TaxID=2499629 RepID=UPI00100B45B6|nr:phosphoribosylformylglycinamidine synthase I [Edaphocola flava]